MACYKPMIRAEDLGKWEKAEDGHRYHPAKIFSSENLEAFDMYRSGYYKMTPIPCGKCIGCRLDYSRDWANRGYLESLGHEQNYFVTLTYDENNLYIPESITTSEDITYTEIDEIPWQGSLVPKDLQKFMHDLRQIMKRKYNHDGIRFMAAGEYGEQGKRPHYHLIIFNLPLPLETFYKPRIDWEKNVYYQNSIIEQAWKKGISNITETTWNNIAYTARYITKKLNGPGTEDVYAAQGQIKEFFRTSRNPGIGYDYYQAHKNEIYNTDSILIKNRKGAHRVKPPKYYDKMYEKEEPKKMKRVKEKRHWDMIQAMRVKGQTTSLTRWEQNMVEMASKEIQSKALRRNLEREEKT